MYMYLEMDEGRSEHERSVKCKLVECSVTDTVYLGHGLVDEGSPRH